MNEKFKKGDYVKTDSTITGKIEIGKIENISKSRLVLIISIPCGNGRTFYMGGIFCPIENIKKATKSEIEKYYARTFQYYHAGWKINWIAKKLKIDHHTVKYHLDEKYRKRRLELSSRRMKRILADLIERKKQFARVDACRKERRKKDSRYRKWVRSVTRKAGKKYDEKNREKRREKALERHRKKTNRYISTNIDNR